MSIKSQEKNMRRLVGLLSQDLGYIWGEKECGPNGAKKEFLNLGKVFLRALAKDLELQEAKVRSNAGGIAVSGECMLDGQWENGGIYIQISQPCCGGDHVILYRTVKDGKHGFNQWITLDALRDWPYSRLVASFAALRQSRELTRAA